jgi:hypothetical protein
VNPPTIIQVEIECPNNSCPGMDVDQPVDSLPVALRVKWGAKAIEHPDGSVTVTSLRYCQECGTEGEVI